MGFPLKANNKKLSVEFNNNQYTELNVTYFLIFVNKPLATATKEKITGKATTIKVAMFTLAANATGNIPNPAFAGASKSVPKEIK